MNYNHNVPFSQFRSYAWGSNNANQIQNPVLAQAAQRDLNHALSSKGLQMVQPSKNPDLIVTSSGGERAQTQWNAWSMRGIGGGFGGITPEQNVAATMIVSVYNPKTQELVWRGVALNTLSNDGNKDQQSVEKAIQKMFKQWPKE